MGLCLERLGGRGFAWLLISSGSLRAHELRPGSAVAPRLGVQ